MSGGFWVSAKCPCSWTVESNEGEAYVEGEIHSQETLDYQRFFFLDLIKFAGSNNNDLRFGKEDVEG